MNYQECINQIRDLGFSDDAEIEEFGELIQNSINRAISLINLKIDPIIEKYEFDIDDTDSGILYLEMPEIDNKFLTFVNTPVLYADTRYVTEDGKRVAKETEYYKRFNDFDIENNDTVVINIDNLHIGKDCSMSFRVFYKAEHEHFNGDTMLSNELPLPLRSHVLVPLLASYYVWLEDEPAKAAQYYNLYEQEAESIVNSNLSTQIRVRVLDGGM